MTLCFVARISNPGEWFGKPFYEVDVPSPLRNGKSSRPRPLVAGVRDEVQFAAAKFAGDLHAEIFDRHTQFFRAMRAVGIECDRLGGRAGEVESERAGAVFTRDSLSDVFAVDPQFFVAMWAEDVVAGRRNFDHAVHLLQWDELRDFDAIRF